MYFETGKFCHKCDSEITAYTAKNTFAKCAARTLPGWRKCKCGWQEISIATFNELVPNWKELLDPDSEDEDEYNGG